jgi:hypothetical protein
MEYVYRPNRRTFLQTFSAAATGAVVEAALAPVGIGIDEGYRVARRGLGMVPSARPQQDACLSPRNPAACQPRPELTEDQRRDLIIAAPLLEEVIFRKLPSYLCGSGEANKVDKQWGLTARELVVGLGSSVLSMLVRGKTPNGYSLAAAPLSEGVNAFGYWCMQRKLGFAANATAHGVHNLASISLQELGIRGL